MTDQNKTIASMDDELWQTYDLFRDPLLRRADPALVTAVTTDIYQLYRFMSGMDKVQGANPQLPTMMGDELAQAYDLFKDPLRRTNDPVMALAVMDDLDKACIRIKPARRLDLDPAYAQDLGFPPEPDEDPDEGSEGRPRG